MHWHGLYRRPDGTKATRHFFCQNAHARQTRCSIRRPNRTACYFDSDSAYGRAFAPPAYHLVYVDLALKYHSVSVTSWLRHLDLHVRPAADLSPEDAF
jgi:hypothetical protein